MHKNATLKEKWLKTKPKNIYISYFNFWFDFNLHASSTVYFVMYLIGTYPRDQEGEGCIDSVEM